MSLKSQCEGEKEKFVECIRDVNGKGTNTSIEEKESDDVSSIDSVRSDDDVSQLLLTLSSRHDALREEERMLQAAIVAAEIEIETMEAQKEELRKNFLLNEMHIN